MTEAKYEYFRTITDDDVLAMLQATSERKSLPVRFMPISDRGQTEWLIVSMRRREFENAVQPLIDMMLEEQRQMFFDWETNLKETDIPEGWR